MPLYEFVCDECGHKQEHFFTSESSRTLLCPECDSSEYNKVLSKFTMNVEYKNVKEIMEYKIDPSVKETHAKIGREVLDQDTKTLDNIYGKEKIEQTFYGSDD